MGIQNFAQRTAYKLRTFIVLQLFLTCMSLPILVWWGLPVSLLSPVGNLVFSPFLTVFLSLASLLFFAQLLHIPNGLIAWALDLLTKIWLTVLKWYPPGMLIAFSQPPWWILVVPPIFALIVIAHPRTRSANRSAVLMTVGLFFFGFALKLLCSTSTDIFSIPCNNTELFVMRSSNTVVVIDPGAIGRRASGPSWVQHTLLTQLAKKSGLRHIDHLVLCKINKTVFESVAELARITHVGTVYVPYWQGRLEPSTIRAFMQLKEELGKRGGTIIRLGEKPHTIMCDQNKKITLNPIEKKIVYQDGWYRTPRIIAHIDNGAVPLYDASGIRPVQSIISDAQLNRKLAL
jgi:hypothetical protein